MNVYGVDKEICKNMKKAVSKIGYTIVCDEEDERAKANFVLPAGEICENMKRAVSKAGYTMVCID